LQQTRDVAKSVPGSQLNWTMAKGGDVGNQIPELASAYGDVRARLTGRAEAATALQEKVNAGHLIPDTHGDDGRGPPRLRG
jgi:glutamate carboxypeptidase